jgi:hypothetical protein
MPRCVTAWVSLVAVRPVHEKNTAESQARARVACLRHGMGISGKMKG